ncbi:MAG: hemolysin family protein [Lentisphaeria bacterium]|jgi:putative hemolysin
MATILSFLPLVLGIVVLMSFSAFFSASETALLSLNRAEVKRMGNGSRLEQAAAGLLKRPERLLATVLIGNLTVNVMLASLCAALLGRLLAIGGGPAQLCQHVLAWFDVKLSAQALGGVDEVIGGVLNVIIVTPLLMIFGEQTPKVVAYAYAPQLARVAAYPLRFLGGLLSPAIWCLNSLSDFFLRVLGLKGDNSWEALTSDELAATLSAGAAGGATNERERELLQRILRLGAIDVKEIMVPRTELVAVSDTLTLQEAYDKARTNRISRMPVYHGDLDDIWGVLSFSDYPRWRNQPEMTMLLSDFRERIAMDDEPEIPATINSPVFPVYMAPETVKIDRLLTTMRKRGAQFAVVVNEYGGTSGIVTLNDILEEIIGRYSRDGLNEDVLHESDGVIHADGRAHLRVLQERYGDAFANEEGSADTIGGLMMETLGRLPRTGDTAALPGFLVRVNRMAGRRVGSVAITAVALPDDTGEGRRE